MRRARVSSLIVVISLSCLGWSGTPAARAQIIDFETLPGGAPTVDQQTISTEYASLGVTFDLLDRVTGQPSGVPRIAKAGLPETAFEGCYAADTPYAYLGLGSSFLTDGTALGIQGDLRITYANPVAQASGVIIDVDCRINGGPPCEQWTLTAYDAGENPLQTIVLDAPQGPINPECQSPQAGPGDSNAMGWTFDVGTAQISSIILRYTGDATNVGLAFDNFSVAGPPAPLGVTITGAPSAFCLGEHVTLTAHAAGGLPPYDLEWQVETRPSHWTTIGAGSTLDVQPLAETSYRVILTDAALSTATSAVTTLSPTASGPLCAASLLVSSYDNDRVVRYSFLSHAGSVFVASGAGSLNGTSKLTCGPDGDLYVVSQLSNSVLKYDGVTGAFVSTFVTAGSGGLSTPVGLDFGPDGNLYVVSSANNSVLRYDGTTGAFIDVFIPNGSGLNNPTGMIFGPDQNLYVCSRDSDKVLRFDGTTGAYLGDFVAAGSGGLDSPRGLCFGPDGNLYVAEEINDSVRRYDGTTGAFIDVFITSGSGGLDRANDVAFGPDGVAYVASYNSDQVLLYDGSTGAPLGALPNDLVNGPAWLAVGCHATATPVDDRPARPAGLVLEPNTPNPFNPRTTVSFTLDREGHARLAVLDVSGRVVATLIDGDLPAGQHSVQWDGRDARGRAVPSGVYLVDLQSGHQRQSGKMMLLR